MILRRKLFPLNFAEGDPPAPASGGAAETRGACPVCQSEITCAGGVIRGGAPSQQYTDLTRERDRAQELQRRVSELEAARPPAPPEPAPAPAPAPPARPKRNTFL